QFPEPGDRQVEAGSEVVPEELRRTQQRGADDDPDRQQQTRTTRLRERDQDDRPYDVELLLDAERPQVQQGLGLAARVEVPGLTPVEDVRDEERTGEGVHAQAAELVGKQCEPTDGIGPRQHQEQGREYPADATRVELEVI